MMLSYIVNEELMWHLEMPAEEYEEAIAEGRLDPAEYIPVVEPPMPTPAPGKTYDKTGPVLIDGSYTIVWSERNMTPEELEKTTVEKNRRTIEESLDLRMAALQAILDDTNANINTNPAARIKDLARAMRLLIRMARNDFGGTS